MSEYSAIELLKLLAWISTIPAGIVLLSRGRRIGILVVATGAVYLCKDVANATLWENYLRECVDARGLLNCTGILSIRYWANTLLSLACWIGLVAAVSRGRFPNLPDDGD